MVLALRPISISTGDGKLLLTGVVRRHKRAIWGSIRDLCALRRIFFTFFFTILSINPLDWVQWGDDVIWREFHSSQNSTKLCAVLSTTTRVPALDRLHSWGSYRNYLNQCWWRYGLTRPQWVNSLTPGRPRCHCKTAIFNLVLFIGIFISCKVNAMRWMPRDLTNDKSTLVQLMAWCRQATSHYLNQCWPRSQPPFGVIRPQC